MFIKWYILRLFFIDIFFELWIYIIVCTLRVINHFPVQVHKIDLNVYGLSSDKEDCSHSTGNNSDVNDIGPLILHNDVIKWKHFPRNWPFVWEPHRSLVNSPHKGQWRGALMFSLICAWINDWVNNREACDLRRHRTHYDVIVMCAMNMN